MNISDQENVDATLERWLSESSLLRIVGSVDSKIGFDSLCRISREDAFLFTFKWSDGLAMVMLNGFSTCELLTPDPAPDADSFEVREEVVCQLHFVWPSGSFVLISELRRPS